ncbi:hypothetical protein HDU93_007873 [Gonapodya sp. JEL0774]|nr:hypothetical protein HDU93_007873 [Gonapodya sp. JEL0774]
MDDTPQSQPPWLETMKKLLIENKLAGPASNYLSLATCRSPPNPPAVRTLVYRGVLGDVGNPENRACLGHANELSNMLVLCTDVRSAKVGEVEASAAPEFNVELERRHLWKRLSPGMRASFATGAPGVPRDPDGIKNNEKESDPDAGLINFALVLFQVDRAEILALAGEMERKIFERGKGGAWNVTDVNP